MKTSLLAVTKYVVMVTLHCYLLGYSRIEASGIYLEDIKAERKVIFLNCIFGYCRKQFGRVMPPKLNLKSDIITGISRKKLPGNHLPSEYEVISFFRYQCENQKNTTGKSIRIVATETIRIWKQAGLPHQLIQNVARRVTKLVATWRRLKKLCWKNKSRITSSKMKLQNVFNIGTIQIEDELQNDFVRAEFWEQQKLEKIPIKFPQSMGKILPEYFECCEKESKVIEKNPRKLVTRNRNEVAWRYFEDESKGVRRHSKMLKPLTKAVVENIDRARVSNREAVGVLAATSAALGVDPGTLSLSRSTLQRQRKITD